MLCNDDVIVCFHSVSLDKVIFLVSRKDVISKMKLIVKTVEQKQFEVHAEPTDTVFSSFLV